MKRSRWLIPAGFFLAVSGGGLAVSVGSLGPRADLHALILQADVAPDRRPQVEARSADRDAAEPFARTSVAPILRTLRFAILRSQSPPRCF